jgi:chromosome segregation ATPase
MLHGKGQQEKEGTS